MPNTKITKERLKTHWTYNVWKYLLMIVVFVVGWNLIYNATEYRPPREKRLEMYILGTAYSDDKVSELQDELTAMFVGEEEGDMEQVNLFTMNYGGDDDTYGPQVLMTRIAALEGDVYMVDEAVLSSFVAQDLAMPLDDYIDSGALNVERQDLEMVTRAEIIDTDDDSNPIYSGEYHVYALQAEPLYGMLESGLADNRGKYLIVTSYTDKADTAVALVNELVNRYMMDKPQWIIDQEERKKQEIEQLPTELTVESLKAQATAEPTAEPAP